MLHIHTLHTRTDFYKKTECVLRLGQRSRIRLIVICRCEKEAFFISHTRKKFQGNVAHRDRHAKYDHRKPTHTDISAHDHPCERNLVYYIKIRLCVKRDQIPHGSIKLVTYSVLI